MNVLPVENSDKKKLCGDVDFEAAKNVASYITPVPGGVGPMTVTMLLRNTFERAKLKRSSVSTHWKLSLLPLPLESPVPHDIDISRAQTPKHVGELAAEIGLLLEEVDMYGRTKAKVSFFSFFFHFVV